MSTDVFPRPLPRPSDCRLAEQRLGDMVKSIEFTMISVIAGLMLFPLIENATPLVRELRLEFWVYILTQFSIVMFFWTALIAHALTFVAWPIDIGHNLIYLFVFPVVGIEMHFMSDPRTFYPMLVVITLSGMVLTVYDLSLIRRRGKDARGAAAELYAAVQSRQATLVILVLVALLVTIVMAVLVSVFPVFFVDRHGHVILGIGLLAYVLLLVFREFRKMSQMQEKILTKTAEETAAVTGSVP